MRRGRVDSGDCLRVALGCHDALDTYSNVSFGYSNMKTRFKRPIKVNTGINPCVSLVLSQQTGKPVAVSGL